MISLKSTIAALALSVMLSACGGGGTTGAAAEDEAPSKTPASAQPSSLIFIGNSITLMEDWGRGASASVPETDYVHMTATALKLPFAAKNFASLEQNPTDAFNHVDMTTPVGQQIITTTKDVNATTAVVVELGDNALNFDGFAVNYAQLLTYVKVANRFVCVSTWWGNADKDKIIKTACESAGGKYVYIGDIYPDAANVGAYVHPNDAGMAKIAQRVAAALQ